jgi:mRNA-degrading endonuclease RelE of RelBE toxin-antitoxin system
MNFEVKLTDTAQKELRRLPEKVNRQVANALDALEKDPRAGSPLQWQLKGYWSYHAGTSFLFQLFLLIKLFFLKEKFGYRVVYEIDDLNRVVLVEHIKHRKDIYRDIQRR